MSDITSRVKAIIADKLDVEETVGHAIEYIETVIKQ